MAKKKQNESHRANPAASMAVPGGQPIDRTTYYLVALLLIMAIYAFFRYKLLGIPLERDEGSYGYLGQLLLDGKRPYIDFYEMKPPALYYSYAVLVAIFGASTVGLHTGVLILCMLTAAMIYQISKVLYHRDGALLAVMAYLQLSLSAIVSGFTAQAEHIVVFYVVTGFYLLTKAYQQDKVWQWIVAGAFLGNAVMTKQVAAVFGPAALALAWIAANQSTPNGALKKWAINSLLIALGATLVIGAWLALIWGYGAWGDMMFWLFDYPKGYTTLFTWDERRDEFWGVAKALFKYYKPIWILAGAGLVLGYIFKKYNKISPFTSLFFLGALIAVFPGYYFYGHYWLYFAPAVAFCVAAALSEIREKLVSQWPAISILSFTLIGLVFLLNFIQLKNYYTSPNFKEIIRTAYDNNPFSETEVIANYIKKKAQPNDQLVVMGSEPQINFITNLRSPTRHFFMGYLTKGRAEEIEWIKETKRDIEAAKPRFLVFAVHPYSWAYLDNKKTDMFNYAFDYSAKNYTLIGVADMIPGGTKYLWDDQARAYPPPKPGSMYVLTFERKPEAQ